MARSRDHGVDVRARMPIIMATFCHPGSSRSPVPWRWHGRLGNGHWVNAMAVIGRAVVGVAEVALRAEALCL